MGERRNIKEELFPVLRDEVAEDVIRTREKAYPYTRFI